MLQKDEAMSEKEKLEGNMDIINKEIMDMFKAIKHIMDKFMAIKDIMIKTNIMETKDNMANNKGNEDNMGKETI